MLSIKNILLLLILSCVAQGAHANEGTVSAEFTSIYWGQSDPAEARAAWESLELYYFTDGEYILLKPQFSQFSPPARYRGPANMVLYKRVMDAEGLWQYQPSLQVRVPRTPVFALFMASSAEGDSYTAAAIDISEKMIPSGSIGLLNLCGETIAADVRGDRRSLQPYQLQTFTPKEAEDAESLPLKIAVFQDEWKPAYSTVARFNPTRPYLIVFYLAQNREGAYRVRIFRNLYQYRHTLAEAQNES